MPTYLLDLTRGELGLLAAQLATAASALLPSISEHEAQRIAEDLLFSRCRDRLTCARARRCRAGPPVWSTQASPAVDAPLCLVDSEIEDLPWIFAAAVLDRAGLPSGERVRAAGILRALFRGALAPCLRLAEGCPLAAPVA